MTVIFVRTRHVYSILAQVCFLNAIEFLLVIGKLEIQFSKIKMSEF